MSKPVPATSQQLYDLREQVGRVNSDLEEIVIDLKTSDLSLRPEAGRWSIAECVVHLSLFSETLLPLIREACGEARKKGLAGGGRFKMDTIGRLLKYSLEPPYKIRVATSAPFEPGTLEPLDQVVPHFLDLQAGLQEVITESEGLNLNRIKIASPVSSKIRYNLFSCFNVIVAHERRHVWQAAQVRAALKRNHTR